MCCELTSDFIFHLIFSCENHGSQPRNPHPTGHDYDQVEQRCHINIIIFNELAALALTIHPLAAAYRINLPVPPPLIFGAMPTAVINRRNDGGRKRNEVDNNDNVSRP